MGKFLFGVASGVALVLSHVVCIGLGAMWKEEEIEKYNQKNTSDTNEETVENEEEA